MKRSVTFKDILDHIPQERLDEELLTFELELEDDLAPEDLEAPELP